MKSHYFTTLCIAWSLLFFFRAAAGDLLPLFPIGGPISPGIPVAGKIQYNSSDVCSGAAVADIVIKNALKCNGKDSCQRRCGQVGEGQDDCSCDANCIVYGDCCYDYDNICRSDSRLLRNEPTTAAIPLCVETIQDEFVLLLGKGCLPHWEGTSMKTKCLSNSTALSYKIPVYDTQAQLHYKNVFCAKCNDVANYRFWNASFECPKKFDTSRNITDPLKVFQQNQCALKVLPPLGVTGRHCHAGGTVNRCQPNSRCTPEIQDACTKYKNTIEMRGKVYQNEYCAVCNGKSMSNAVCPMQMLIPPTFPRPSGSIPPIDSVLTGSTDVEITGGKQPDLGSFSFSIVMDFSSDSEVAVGVHVTNGDGDVTKCSLDEVTSSCVPFQCRKDYVLADDACVLDVVVYDMHVNTLWKPNTTSDPLVILLVQDQELYQYGQRITNFITQLYGEGVYGDVTFGAVRKAGESFLIHNDFKLQFNKTTEAGDIENDWITETRSVKFRSLLGMYVSFINSTVSSSLYHDPRTPSSASNATNGTEQMSPIAETDCERVRFDNYAMTENGDILLLPSRQIINESDVFYESNHSILVCRDLVNNTRDISNADDMLGADDSRQTLGILTIVCMAISLVCLLIRISLQPFVSPFQTFPGKLQLCLCLSLVMWKVFFLARPFAASSNDVSACVAVAVLFHWSLLMSFFWMNVIAIDLWKTFRSTSSLRISSESNKTIIGYVCYATLLPGGIVALCLVLDYMDIDPQFKPHYSGPACYIDNFYPLVLFLVAPIGAVLIVNIFMYIMIAKSIYVAISESGKLKARRNKHNFIIYVRLFFLMGTTWLFGFLSGGLNVLALNYIFIILTTLDGLFIFIAVVCSKRVWRDLRDRKPITRTSTRTLTLSSSNKLSSTPKSPTPSESKRFSLTRDTNLSQL